MCGIFGVVTNKAQNLGPILVGAGERLSYRGYDTVGAATLPQEGEIDLRKDAGKVQEVAFGCGGKVMMLVILVFINGFIAEVSDVGLISPGSN